MWSQRDPVLSHCLFFPLNSKIKQNELDTFPSADITQTQTRQPNVTISFLTFQVGKMLARLTLLWNLWGEFFLVSLWLLLFSGVLRLANESLNASLCYGLSIFCLSTSSLHRDIIWLQELTWLYHHTLSSDSEILEIRLRHSSELMQFTKLVCLCKEHDF